MNTEQLTLDVVGQGTGERYTGIFEVRTSVTLKQQAAADEARRMILGFNPDAAADGIKNLAFVAGQLSVRLVGVPDWWKKYGLGGIDLPEDDSNVLEELFDKVIGIQSAAKEKIRKDANLAAERLKSKGKE